MCHRGMDHNVLDNYLFLNRVMQTVVVFDFDGTLTTRDSFLAFIRFSCGLGRFFFGFTFFAPLLFAMKVGIYPNWKAKQKVFAYFFHDMPESRFNLYCEDFCRECLPHILRRSMINTIGKYYQRNNTICIIISASIDRWIYPWARKVGITVLLCTEIEVVDGKLTGRFITPNCYGAEKVRRLLSVFPNRNDYYLIVYGDSRGDREILSFADEHYLL